ncbi:hypothetical protein EDD11_004058 [Mortierella claussenii]|nr:hypothetical protein EDD11_004058 [Mortierella claussenii]
MVQDKRRIRSVGVKKATKLYPRLQSPHSTSSSLSPPKIPDLTAVGISSSGKRYIDPGDRKKNRKKATKMALTLFSNERTFIHWIKFSMLLGTLALTLLNFAGEKEVNKEIDHLLARNVGGIGQGVGVGLMVICLLCLVYSATVFHWRHVGVKNEKEENERYFDRIGPTLLTIVLFIAYGMNVLLTIQASSNMNPDYLPTVFYNNKNFPDQSFTNSSTQANTTDSHLMPSPAVLSPPLSSNPPVFDTPPLPPGSTIMIDDEDDYDTDNGNQQEEESDTTIESVDIDMISKLSSSPSSSFLATMKKTQKKGASLALEHETRVGRGVGIGRSRPRRKPGTK